MKFRKNVIGLFAILLALGVSAFTTISKHQAAKKFTSYYWFQVDALGNTVPSAIAPSAETKADNPFGCPNSGADICARGYLNYQYDQSTQTYMPTGSVQDYTNKQGE